MLGFLSQTSEFNHMSFPKQKQVFRHTEANKLEAICIL